MVSQSQTNGQSANIAEKLLLRSFTTVQSYRLETEIITLT